MTTTPAKSVAPPAASPPAPDTIGRYKVIGRLGKGGMAEVLLTMQHEASSDFKRLVVVKRVLPDLESEDMQFIQMFLDEARLAARLNHSNIVQTYEVGQEGASPFLAMEFLEGQSLNVLQRRAHVMKAWIPVPVALRIFCDVLEGLQYAHDLKDFDGKPLGVIHRDVTPSNVFVKYDGVSKLVDFGIAKSATQREKTRAGMIKGKMAYMAPEQFRDGVVTRSVDVWSMGIVIWETLAGERLFRGKNEFETVQAAMKREVPKLSEMRPDIPAAMDKVLAGAINRDPAKRLQSAEELKSGLEEVAFKLGEPMRRTDVAKLMVDLFGTAIEQNQKMVKDFLDRSAGGLNAASEFLRFKSTGALEVSTETPGADSARTSGEVAASSATLLLPIDRKGAGLDDPPTGTGAGSFREDHTTVDDRPPVHAEAMVVAGDKRQGDLIADEDEDEDEARPTWHWLALGVALLSVAAAVWYLLAG